MVNFLLEISINGDTLDIGNISISISKIEEMFGKCVKILVIIILMALSIKIGNKAIDKFVEKQIGSKGRFSMQDQKAKTIGAVLKSVLKYGVYFIGIAIILADLFSGISLTFASIGGFAVGFGAQSLVKDIINGFFILFEDQYGVGDHVTIDKFTGIVDGIGIRTTVLKDFTGDIHLIPNGAIVHVTNHSRNNIRFMVDVDIAYEENIDNAIAIIEEVCKEFEANNTEIAEPIEVLGAVALASSGVTIRVIGRSKPLKQWKMERELRKEIKDASDKSGIEIPYPKTQIVTK